MLEDDEDRDPEAPATHNARALEEGLVLGRVVWFGGKDLWWDDLWFYVENEHTLISTWRGHALHPFERFDRVCYFMCVACFSLFLSAYIQHEHPIHAGAVAYGGWVTLSSILLVVYDVLLRFFATCPCMHAGGSCHGACWLCRDCVTDAGKQGLYIVSIGSFGFLIAGVVLAATADVDPGMYFATFLTMRVLSYLGEFPVLAYSFYARREAQREHWLEGASGGPYPLGFSSPDPLFVRETRKDGVNSGRWTGTANPMHERRDSASVRRDAAAAAPSRDKKIEMLQRARDRVRAEGGDRDARQTAAASAAPAKKPPRPTGPQAGGAADDPLDSFGARR